MSAGSKVAAAQDLLFSDPAPDLATYDLNMPRLSCMYGSRSSLVLAAQHNPGAAAEYVRVELATGHRF